MAVQLAVQLHLHLQYNRSCTAVQLQYNCSTIGNHIRIVLALLGRNGSTIGSTIGSIPSGIYFAPRHRRNGPQDRRNCEEKSEFAHGCCVAAVHGIYAWHTTQNPSAICWQISTMAVQWQYNGGNGSVMAVQLTFVFASYSHRIGTIWHYIGTILALYWHSWVVMAVQYRPLRSPPSVGKAIWCPLCASRCLCDV